MVPRRFAALLLAIPLLLATGRAGDNTKQVSGRITKEQRMEVIRGLNAELAFARTAFPMGTKGLILKDGVVVSPTQGELQQLLADFGPAAKPGDRARITDVQFKGNLIHFEINGGPRKKQKWYQRIQVGGMGGTVPLSPSDPNANPRGSFVDLTFDKYIPELTPVQVKQMLAPVLDFTAHSAAEAYMATLPPKVRDAIKNHRVLVGMDREMVTYAKGRPPKKIRERDGKTDYEEWIYGDPPQDVEFVRLVGDQVIRIETMKVDGQKIVRTEKEVDIRPQPSVAQEQPPQPRPADAPTLRRPGEDAPDNQSAGRVAPMPRPNPTDNPAPPPADPTKGPQ